jgi:mannosyl-3-phosphoglycerate phosphatase
MNLIIFTDLDGTLLDREDYDYKPALPVLARLKELQIPVIPVTSKTRQEVEFLRQEIGLEDPFIVENGSGIFIPSNENRFLIDDELRQGNYHLKLLGCTYQEAKEGLATIAKSLNIAIEGFGDLSEEEIARLTNLPAQEVKLAKAREFTEPFLTPSQCTTKELEMVAESVGFRVLLGDRFSHLLGADAGKGKAVCWLMANYLFPANTEVVSAIKVNRLTKSERKVLTVGLGNSPNDLEMLESVDIPIVIPNRKGPHPSLAARGWRIASAPGSAGWAETLNQLFDRELGY